MFLRLEQIGFSSSYLEEVLRIMRSNLQQLDHVISFGGRYFFENDDKMNQREEKILKELNSLMESIFKDKTTELLNEIMKHRNGWGGELHDYVNRNRSNIFRDKEFISKINMRLLINQIDNSSTEDIHYLAWIQICKRTGGALFIQILSVYRRNYMWMEAMQMQHVTHLLKSMIELRDYFVRKGQMKEYQMVTQQ